MARLKLYDVEILGQNYQLPLNCSTDGVFSTKWPSIILDRITQLKRGFASLEELKKAIDEAAKQVNSQQETYQDFIVFKFAIQHFNHNEQSEGCRLGLQYMAIREWTTGAKVEHSEIEIEEEWLVFDRPYMRDPESEENPNELRGGVTEVLADLGNKKYLVVKAQRVSAGRSYYSDKLNWTSTDRIPFTLESYLNIKKLHDNMLTLGDKVKQLFEQAKELKTFSTVKLLPEEKEVK